MMNRIIRRFGQIAKLKPEKIEEYDTLHAAVWDSVLKTIKECNIRNYSIYRKGELLFAYFEYTGTDYEADMDKMAADPATQEWWAHTKPCFVQEKAGEFYTDMKDLFHID
jgi:L-rhamnose mutarotase